MLSFGGDVGVSEELLEVPDALSAFRGLTIARGNESRPFESKYLVRYVFAAWRKGQTGIGADA
jgi:hypothetical protein